MKIKATEIIKKLMETGMMVTINQTIDFDTATLIATDFGYEVKSNVKSIDEVLGKGARKEDAAYWRRRTPTDRYGYGAR